MFTFAALTGSAATSFAQNPDQPKPAIVRPERMPDGFSLLRQLGLSQEQAQQLRKFNQEQRPKMEAAHHNLRTANDELDAAIYADTIDDAVIAEKVRNVESAQSAMIRLRYENELAIRKLLTPEQLVRFREARERLQQLRTNMPQRRGGPQPMRRGDGPGQPSVDRNNRNQPTKRN